MTTGYRLRGDRTGKTAAALPGGGVPVLGHEDAPPFDPRAYADGPERPCVRWAREHVSDANPGPAAWQAEAAWDRLRRTGCPHVFATLADAAAHGCDYADHPARVRA